jgi:hypothetical protein
MAFVGAACWVMVQRNARQKISRDDTNRRLLIDGPGRTVARHHSKLICYVLMGSRPDPLGETLRPHSGEAATEQERGESSNERTKTPLTALGRSASWSRHRPTVLLGAGVDNRKFQAPFPHRQVTTTQICFRREIDDGTGAPEFEDI